MNKPERVWNTKPVKIPEGFNYKKFCKDCHIYKDRGRNARIMRKLTGESTLWAIESCYASCIKDTPTETRRKESVARGVKKWQERRKDKKLKEENV